MKKLAFLAFLLLPTLLRAPAAAQPGGPALAPALRAGSSGGQDDTASQAALKAEETRVGVVREALKKTALVGVASGDTTVPAGSGAVISADGLIVTCAHVVEGARAAVGGDFRIVLADGTTHEAKVLGLNSKNDIALLKIEAEKLPHFELADRRPAKDELVIALGYPMGNVGDPWKNKGQAVHPSVALGRVLEPSRKFGVQTQDGGKYYPDCIESDTPIFMGNSGGPLVNEKGELVGLNAAIAWSGKSYTLSSGSICRCLDTLKDGRDADGEQGELSPEDYGKILWDALGLSGAAEGERAWILEDFAAIAKARRASVLTLLRGEKVVGCATVLDAKGRLVASMHAVDKKGFWSRIADEIEKGVEDEGIRSFLKGAREFLGLEESEALRAKLPSGRTVSVTVEKKSTKLGLALLSIEPGDEKLTPVPAGDLEKAEPGSWVAVVGTRDVPIAAGLLSTRKHTVNSAMKVPLSPTEWFESWTNDDLKEREFVDVILFDARLAPEELGTPLCDSRGRLLGITIYHPSRGTSYAASMAGVYKEFGLDK